MRQIYTSRGAERSQPVRDFAYLALSSTGFRTPESSSHHWFDDRTPSLHALSFERGGFHVCIANGSEALKRQTAKLIERMYSARGLFPYGMHANIDPRDITVVALLDGEAVATATIRVDHGGGLLADTLYSKEIDHVRATGGRVCEITQLAIDPERGSHEALAGVMQAVFVITQATRRVTDIFAEVNPRHAGFHQRVFGFRRVGVEKICPRVNAPAVLLHLPLSEFEERVARHERLMHMNGDRVHRLLPDPVQSRQLIQAMTGKAA